jgi:hypothetical protein
VIHYRVGRSPLRQFLLGLAGILLVVAAIDIVWVHEVSSPPLTDDNGGLTSVGLGWRRTDLIWGAVFMVAGVGLFLAGAVGLARGRAVAELSDDGISLRVGGPDTMVLFPWDDIVSVRSARVPGEGRMPRPQLLLAVRDPTRFPYDLWSAEWIDGVLHVDGDTWAEPPEELAVRAALELERLGNRYRAVESVPADAVTGGKEPEETEPGD